MYVVRKGDTDIATNSELVGYRMRERSDATRQTHLLTLDKLVCEMPTQLTFNENQTALDNEGALKHYGPNEGILISDFDNFMPRNNPIVNFTPVWPPPEEEAKASKS